MTYLMLKSVTSCKNKMNALSQIRRGVVMVGHKAFQRIFISASFRYGIKYLTYMRFFTPFRIRIDKWRSNKRTFVCGFERAGLGLYKSKISYCISSDGRRVFLKARLGRFDILGPGFDDMQALLVLYPERNVSHVPSARQNRRHLAENIATSSLWFRVNFFSVKKLSNLHEELARLTKKSSDTQNLAAISDVRWTSEWSGYLSIKEVKKDEANFKVKRRRPAQSSSACDPGWAAYPLFIAREQIRTVTKDLICESLNATFSLCFELFF